MFKAKLHDKVVLYMANYFKHIRIRHPEVTIEIISSVLSDPDEVCKKSRNSKECYYYKNIDSIEYKVIIAPSEYNRKAVITAYPVKNIKTEHDKYKIYCCFLANDAISHEEQQAILDAITEEYAAILACN